MEEPRILFSLTDPHLTNRGHPLTWSGVTPSTSEDLYGKADLVAGGDVGTIIGNQPLKLQLQRQGVALCSMFA